MHLVNHINIFVHYVQYLVYNCEFYINFYEKVYMVLCWCLILYVRVKGVVSTEN